MKRNFVKIALLGVFAFKTDISSANSYFDVVATGSMLTISTTIPKHTYSGAGIKIVNSGHGLGGEGTDCTPIKNGYCVFSVSDVSPKSISISGPMENIRLKLCLNASKERRCQNYSVKIGNISLMW